jgi:hypothetical protein
MHVGESLARAPQSLASFSGLVYTLAVNPPDVGRRLVRQLDAAPMHSPLYASDCSVDGYNLIRSFGSLASFVGDITVRRPSAPVESDLLGEIAAIASVWPLYPPQNSYS